MEAFNQIMPLTLQRHADPVHAFQPLEDPTQGRRRWGVMAGVRHGLLLRGPLCAESALCHGVHQHRQRHHHEEAFTAVGLFDNQRRDKTQRVFEQPKTPFNVPLAFGGGDPLGVAPLVGGDIGAKERAGLGLLSLRKRCVIRLDVDLDGALRMACRWRRAVWDSRCQQSGVGSVR